MVSQTTFALPQCHKSCSPEVSEFSKTWQEHWSGNGLCPEGLLMKAGGMKTRVGSKKGERGQVRGVKSSTPSLYTPLVPSCVVAAPLP